MILVLAAFSAINTLCLLFLFTPSARDLTRKPWLIISCVLPMGATAVAIQSFADPGGRVLILPAFGLSYLLILLLLSTFLQKRESSRHFVLLFYIFLGTTLLLLLSLGLTGSCAFGICV